MFFGYLALIISALISYFLFSLLIADAFPNFPQALINDDSFTPIAGAPSGLENWMYILLAIIGGFGMGLLGVFLGGCPLRQTIMATEGNLKSWFFF